MFFLFRRDNSYLKACSCMREKSICINSQISEESGRIFPTDSSVVARIGVCSIFGLTHLQVCYANFLFKVLIKPFWTYEYFTTYSRVTGAEDI